jgi:hypothetical protein
VISQVSSEPHGWAGGAAPVGNGPKLEAGKAPNLRVTDCPAPSELEVLSLGTGLPLGNLGVY